MPIISRKKEEKIKEAILLLLFQNSPKAMFTYCIAQEIARDEEFTKKLLLDLEARKLVVAVKKNNKGLDYIRRTKWRLSNKVYEAYKKLSRGSFKESTFAFNINKK